MNILITSKDDDWQFLAGDKRVGIILAHEWMKMGHRVCFVCHSTSPDCPQEVDGIKQYLLPDRQTINTPGNEEAFRRIIAREHADIVLQQHMRDIGMIRLCGKLRDLAKVVSVLHFDVDFDDKILAESFFISWRNGRSARRYFHDFLLYVRYLLFFRRKTYRRISSIYRECAEKSDKVVLLSDNMIAGYCRRAGCTESKVAAMPNPAQITVDAEACRHKEKMVVWAGRLDFSQKRYDRMLQAWKRIQEKHPDWQLKLLGSGKLDEVCRQIKTHGVNNVEAPGFCDPMPYYEKASIVCMTSTSEGWGMVLVEGQAHGCAVMAYDSYGSASEIIDDGETGFLVRPFSVKEYADKLAWLMDHDQERQQMAAEGTRRVRRYNSEKIAQQWIDFFQQL